MNLVLKTNNGMKSSKGNKKRKRRNNNLRGSGWNCNINIHLFLKRVEKQIQKIIENVKVNKTN
jgi:hypothetical protein